MQSGTGAPSYGRVSPVSLMCLLLGVVVIFIPISIKLTLEMSVSDTHDEVSISPAVIEDQTGTRLGWWDVTYPTKIRENGDASVTVTYRLNEALIKPVHEPKDDTPDSPEQEYADCLLQKQMMQQWQQAIVCEKPAQSTEPATPSATETPPTVDDQPPPLKILQATILAPNFSITPNEPLTFNFSELWKSPNHSVQESWIISPKAEGGPYHVRIAFAAEPKDYTTKKVVVNNEITQSGSEVIMAIDVLCGSKYGVSSALISFCDWGFRGVAFILALPFVVSIITTWLKRKRFIDQNRNENQPA